MRSALAELPRPIAYADRRPFLTVVIPVHDERGSIAGWVSLITGVMSLIGLVPVLAPIGDKYAQYMVGYMNITGKGVQKDYIAGSAWYRLAAERGDASFSKARDEVWALFSDEPRLLSDKEYAELRLEFSDAMIVANLLEKDFALLEEPVPTSSLSLSIDESSLSATERKRQADIARKRINERLEYLDAALSSGREMATSEIQRIKELQERAAEFTN